MLAHPGETPADEEIASFAQAGLDGLEAHYPGYTPALSEYYERLAQDLGLVATGGSDFHGERKLQGLGLVTVPPETVERLRKCASPAPGRRTAAGSPGPGNGLPAAVKDREGEDPDGTSGPAQQAS